MKHSVIISILRHVYQQMGKMKDDVWTLDHLSGMNTNAEKINDFLDNTGFPNASHRPRAEIHPGPATVDHTGLVGLLDEATRWLAPGSDWDPSDLQELDEIGGDLQALSDDIYQRSQYLPPWA